MTEYLVFPIPSGLVKIKASSAEAARNKYRRELPEFNNEELIIIPTSRGKKTSIDIILPLWKCTLREIK